MHHQRQRCIRKLDAAIQDLRKARFAVKHRKPKRAIQNIRHSLVDIGETFRYLTKLER